jgi:hypothetical protein
MISLMAVIKRTITRGISVVYREVGEIFGICYIYKGIIKAIFLFERKMGTLPEYQR